MEELTKTDCYVIIQALNAYDIECAKMFTRITDPYNTNHKAVLQLEEFDEVHGLDWCQARDENDTDVQYC